MYPSGLHYFPVAWPVLLILLVLFGAAVSIVLLGIVRFASASMGIGARTMLGLLLLALLGSYINIPVGYLPQRVVSAPATIDFFGVPYIVPMVREWPATVIAVNVGGAVIPTLLSLYLLVKNHLYLLGLAGIAIVTIVCHLLARPVPGLGVAEPVFIPPLVTAVVAVVLSRRYAAPLAYISGSLGTLVGADLLNLGKIQGLGAPIASIGGAGTFDGIFVTGLLAVVYAGVGMHLGAERKSRGI
ncbi:MAG TPA: DUF1614 domain-containing protein [Steroidobacteraceae bacterium]|nr:DUF1614 domain-containing protein [Steroidobacteraceae bacterium]